MGCKTDLGVADGLTVGKHETTPDDGALGNSQLVAVGTGRKSKDLRCHGARLNGKNHLDGRFAEGDLEFTLIVRHADLIDPVRGTAEASADTAVRAFKCDALLLDDGLL